MSATGRHAPGTAGYAETADALVESYESIAFDDLYRPLIDLLPKGGRALDIGAGTGRDAAALASRGFHVHAAEPTAEMRAHARRLHPDPTITWVDDALPDLPRLTSDGARFDLVLMTAVWMHLDKAERETAWPKVAGLLDAGGRLFMTVRKGPVPQGRRMFMVPIDELVAAARKAGLGLVRSLEFPDMLGREDVSWTMLAFEKGNRV
ncbi:MAG TPA: class I SAM-dependent methyltransferase [Microvirga sp.]|nr:class I SAM-dependent methyltransferase [Microvirga sp.]